MIVFDGVKKKHLCICFTLLLKLNSVISGTVEAIKTNLEVPVNQTAQLHWRVVLDAGELVAALEVLVLGSPNVKVISGNRLESFVTTAGKAMFGNRLSGSFAKGVYTLSIKKIQFNEKKYFNLEVVFKSPSLHSENKTVVIKDVVGGLDVCGIPLNTNYTVKEGYYISFTREVCGNPNPVVTWKLQKELGYSYSTDVVLMNILSMRYRYLYKTRRFVTREDCGTNIVYNATSENGMITGEALIDVTFSPSKIRKVFFYKDNDCINGTWTREAIGNCALFYHLQFEGRSDIFNTSNTDYVVCNLPNVSSLAIWASYKDKFGEKRKINVSLNTRTLPTNLTNSCKITTLLEGNRSNCTDIKTEEKSDANSGDTDYEGFPTTESHYTGLRLKKAKETVYADLSATTTNELKQYSENETINQSKKIYGLL